MVARPYMPRPLAGTRRPWLWKGRWLRKSTLRLPGRRREPDQRREFRRRLSLNRTPLLRSTLHDRSMPHHSNMPRLSNTPRLRKGPLPRMGPCQRAYSAEAWLLRTEARGQPWASVLSSHTTLRQFRQILQIVMGSKNYHLLESLVSETRYEVPDPGSYHGRLKSKCRTRPRCFRLGTSFWSPTREDGSLFRPLQCGSQAGIDGATAHMVRRC